MKFSKPDMSSRPMDVPLVNLELTSKGSSFVGLVFLIFFFFFFFCGFVVPGAPEGSTGRLIFVVVIHVIQKTDTVLFQGLYHSMVSSFPIYSPK